MLSTSTRDSVHNLTYLSYADSFLETLTILEKEYVLNNHKKINYEYLKSKYFPAIQLAEKDKNEQLYFKTMYEFSLEFKDRHFYYSNYFKNFEDLENKLKYMKDYDNRDYGFGTIMLDDGSIVALLVDQNSEAYNLGLRDGMIITKKDDIYANDLLNSVITGYGAEPVKETDMLYKSMFIFATGNETVKISYMNGVEEKEIYVHSIGDYCSKCNEVYNKLNYTNPDLNNLDTLILNDKTGYIYVADEEFNKIKGSIAYITNNNKYIEKVVDKKIDEMVGKGIENLVIDLRGNSGGFFTESAAIAGLFVKDNDIVIDRKFNSLKEDKMFFNGIGKYSNLKLIVLVNSNTISAGDGLAYLLSKRTNTKIIGFTTTSNSFQSVGGIIYLSGGTSFIKYPDHYSLDSLGNIMIDTNETRKANIVLDEKVPINTNSINDIFYTEDNYDYLLKYALKLYN